LRTFKNMQHWYYKTHSYNPTHYSDIIYVCHVGLLYDSFME
jgi:hypothetical protein